MRILPTTIALAAAVACSGELTPIDSSEPGGGGADAGAGGAAAMYRPDIQRDLEAMGCTSEACHGGGSVPMPVTAAPATDDAWMANYNQVKARAGTATASLLIDKATGAGGHIAAVQPGDPMLDRWTEWIELGTPYERSTGGAPDAGTGAADAGPGATGDAAPTLTWEADIGPLMRARGCTDCHGTSGAYSLENYSAALGFGTDELPNVIPGDPLSLLVVYCEQGHHGMPYDDALKVLSWVVDFEAAER